MEGSGGGGGGQGQVTHPAVDVDTKRARKRSRYLSPPYTDTDAQEKKAGGGGGSHSHKKPEEEEEAPPHVSAAEVFSALGAAALGPGEGMDAAALRFLTMYNSRNTNRSASVFADGHPDPHAAAGAGGGGGSQDDGGGNKPPSVSAAGVGRKMLSLDASPGHGTLPKKKKKNPHPYPPPAAAAAAAAAGVNGRMQQKDGNAAVSEHAAAATAATHGHEKKRRNKKTPRHSYYVVGNPVALVLEFAEGTPLPSREDLLSAFSRFGFVIDSETTISQDKHAARVAFATRAQAQAALTTALGGGAFGFGPPFAVPSLQDLPPITPLPKLPLADIRSNLGKMILSLSSKATAAPANSSPQEATAKTAVDSLGLVGEMKCLLAKVDKVLQVQGASATAHHA